MREIKSFDIFDTLLSRTVENPTDIFDIVEKQFPYNNFKKLRLQSQNQSIQTMDAIYNEFKKLTNESDETINKLREFELITEMENTIPILSNISKIKDDDIFVSDMYLSSNEIRKLLDYHHINKNTELFVSSGGKADGTMWEFLTKTYKINSHYGDNYHSDIVMASKYGIKGIYTESHKFTVFESHLIKNNEFELCKQIRKFRLANPYDENTIEYKIYEQQISYNIPILLFICNKLNEILIDENRNTVLFISRDGCLLTKLFSHLYPQYKSIYLHSSRIINNNYTGDYISYLKKNYDKDSCILFDLHGSLNSGKKLFTSFFGHLPRIFIFDLSCITNYISEITYITSHSSRIEEFNQDYKGTLLQFIDNDDIRAPTEHPLKYINLIHSTFDSFIKYFDVNLKNNSILNNNDFFKKYYIETVCNSKPILTNQFGFMNLTELANKYNSDKGDQFLCAHHYTPKYEQIFNDILNVKLDRKDFSTFDLLEIGLNISNTEESIPSLMIWNDYFNKNINITGFDIDNRFLKFNKNQNINIKIGDQSSENDLSQLKDKNYDMIVDDGYHASKHQQITFKTLWENVKPGGYFIIEDLHYQPIHESCVKTKELFLNWSNNNWIETEYINSEEIQIIKKDIESIEFYDSKSKRWGDSVKNAFVYIKKK
jgi:FMN phosphatase YigB (HAD superfamily)